jgi:hypothetical protein
VSSLSVTTLVASRKQQYRDSIGAHCVKEVRERVRYYIIRNCTTIQLWFTTWEREMNHGDYAAIISPGNKRNSSREIKGSWRQPQFHTECTWKPVSKGNKHRQRSTPCVQDKQVPHGELDTTQTHSENLSKHRSTRRIQAQEHWINRPAAVFKYPVQLTLQRTERKSWLYVSFCRVARWTKQKVRTRLWIQCMLPLKCQLLHHHSLHKKKR